jgi:cardiolipin synthase A/B
MKSSNDFTIDKPFLLFGILLCLLISGGCATLPQAEKMVQESANKEGAPTIVGAHRRLSHRDAELLLKRLKSRTLPTDILERQVAVEEAISGTPLVAGNKVTLLVDGPATYDAMSAAILNARDHVNLETFIFERMFRA